MALEEFEIINQFFNKNEISRDDVIVGIGDDAAIVEVPENVQLVLSIDALIESVHFPRGAPPEKIGHKIAAVNLSDLAAMGAKPAWATLALTMPESDVEWLQGFCQGFFSVLKRYNMQLIGGNLSQGQLAITCQVHGFVPTHCALMRCAAKIGDLIYVTGKLGDAGLALKCLKQQIKLASEDEQAIFEKYYRPIPRIEVGLAIHNIAHAVIDISDGLAADLGHILEASKKGAILYTEHLPISSHLKNNLSYDECIEMALYAGDDYELCFTIPINKRDALEKKSKNFDVEVTCIGEITGDNHLQLINEKGHKEMPMKKGFRHFV